MPSRGSIALFLAALAGGLCYIALHVARDMQEVKVTSIWPYLLLALALLIALGFEFVNGFHDTANAVAMVIYTHSLEPTTAVVLSGMCNLSGVLASSGAVAFAIITLLPVELILQVSSGAGFAMVFALLVAAILWNLGTWWLGLPASSSHTMVGSIIGVGIANQLFNPHIGATGVDWEQAIKVLQALLISPVVGFGTAALLMLLSKALFRYPALYEAPKDKQPPPWPIRALTVLTCTGVSFFHGSNDGQKGMGLIMLILIGTMPTAYALNHAITSNGMQEFIAASEQAGHILDRHVDQHATLGSDARAEVTDYIRTQQLQPETILALRELVAEVNHEVTLYKVFKSVPAQEQTNVRNDMYVASEALRLMAKDSQPGLHHRGERGSEELHGQAGQIHQVHPRLGQSGRGAGPWTGHDGGVEARRRHGGRKDRQGAPDLCAGRLRRTRGHGHHLRRRHLRPAGFNHAHPQFRSSGNHGRQRQRPAHVDDSQHRGGLGLHAAGCGAALRPALLALPRDFLKGAGLPGQRYLRATENASPCAGNYFFLNFINSTAFSAIFSALTSSSLTISQGEPESPKRSFTPMAPVIRGLP